ncbi:MAG: hypothetical protein MZU97_09630 [Bacillus subtilis]|nr:hypothetical protein [Bacillus subtilis]
MHDIYGFTVEALADRLVAGRLQEIQRHPGLRVAVPEEGRRLLPTMTESPKELRAHLEREYAMARSP